MRSIESQASRYHVSLKVRHVRPECGVVGLRLKRRGSLCPVCTERMCIVTEMAFNEILQRKAEVAAKRREYDRMRKRRTFFAGGTGLKLGGNARMDESPLT